MKAAIFICLTVALAMDGCVARAGEIMDYHVRAGGTEHGEYNPTPNARSLQEMLASSTNHGVTEIGIERTACFGSCPIYTFIAKSDGTFSYQGWSSPHPDFTLPPMEIKRSGTISIGQFNQLAEFIRDSGYMQLERDYVLGVTDTPSVFTMVVMNGKRKTIRNYAEAGPTKLWAVEQLIDDLMKDALAKAQPKPTEQTPAPNEHVGKAGEKKK